MLRPLFAKSLWTSKVVPSGFCSKRSCQVFLRYGGMQRIDGCLQLYEVWGHRLNGIETHLACFNGATDDSCWGLTLRKQRNFRQLSCVCIRYKQIFLKVKKYRTKTTSFAHLHLRTFDFKVYGFSKKNSCEAPMASQQRQQSYSFLPLQLVEHHFDGRLASMYGYLTM